MKAHPVKLILIRSGEFTKPGNVSGPGAATDFHSMKVETLWTVRVILTVTFVSNLPGMGI